MFVRLYSICKLLNKTEKNFQVYFNPCNTNNYLWKKREEGRKKGRIITNGWIAYNHGIILSHLFLASAMTFTKIILENDSSLQMS